CCEILTRSTAHCHDKVSASHTVQLTSSTLFYLTWQKQRKINPLCWPPASSAELITPSACLAHFPISPTTPTVLRSRYPRRTEEELLLFKNTYGTIGVSKRCCPVCTKLLSLLSKHSQGQIQAMMGGLVIRACQFYTSQS
ncbi:hypothetical protein L211DRAFT_882140, partial [Terfezia boudieri ATCC MYA-4762]